MHCRSCEIILEDNLSKISGVGKVHANYKQSKLDILFSDFEPNKKEIEKAINLSGYTVGLQDTKHWISRNGSTYVELGAVIAVLFLIYAVVDRLQLLSFSPKIGGTPSMVGVLLVGLTAGVSTCMALIGGLVLGMSARHAELHPDATRMQKFRPHLFFNFGRLVSYALLGGLIGLLGSAFQFSSGVLGILTIGLGIVMIFLGLKLIEVFPRLSNKSLVLPKSISRMFGLSRQAKEYSHRGSFITGVLTFFVPCGFTQAMQMYAVSTGSFISGALIMFLFALGTMPGILSLGGLTSVIKGAFGRYFFKFVGVIVILLALFNIGNGMNLAGVNISSVFPPSKNSKEELVNNAIQIKMENGKQVIEMEQASNGYYPNKLTVKKGIPVVWKIKSTNSYTCAAYIRMPDYNIAQPLNSGLNVIEFMPTKTGKVRFTCSMGMYSGTITVIE